MKTVVFGDIHGRDCWKNILQREKPSRVIFLGDYVSSHEGLDPIQQVSNLNNILEYKQNSKNTEIILLRGNHDIQHLTGDKQTCCYSPLVANWMESNRDRFLKNTQWIYEDGDLLFSHAGLVKTWLNRNGFKSISEVNSCTQFIPFEGYGWYGLNSPTWIRPSTSMLLDAIPGKIQVVGHTRLCTGITELVRYSIQNSLVEPSTIGENVQIWCCDALPKQYLTIEGTNFIIKNV